MKRSYIFKQICNFQLQVCLSMYDLLVDTNHLAIVQKLGKKYLPSSIYLAANDKASTTKYIWFTDHATCSKEICKGTSEEGVTSYYFYITI